MSGPKKVDPLGRFYDWSGVRATYVPSKHGPRVDTAEYVFSHGRRPRGRGHWAFRFYRPDSSVVLAEDGGEAHFAPGERLYSDAAAWARRQARAVGATQIAVLS